MLIRLEEQMFMIISCLNLCLTLAVLHQKLHVFTFYPSRAQRTNWLKQCLWTVPWSFRICSYAERYNLILGDFNVLIDCEQNMYRMKDLFTHFDLEQCFCKPIFKSELFICVCIFVKLLKYSWICTIEACSAIVVLVIVVEWVKCAALNLHLPISNTIRLNRQTG